MLHIVKNMLNLQQEDYKTFESERAAFDWASKQAYIVMANMMTMAAYEGLDSCALEGFNQDEMTALLGDELGLFDTKHFGIAVMAAFGYRDEEPHRNKTRRTMDEIVTGTFESEYIKIFTRRMLGP